MKLPNLKELRIEFSGRGHLKRKADLRQAQLLTRFQEQEEAMVGQDVRVIDSLPHEIQAYPLTRMDPEQFQVGWEVDHDPKFAHKFGPLTRALVAFHGPVQVLRIATRASDNGHFTPAQFEENVNTGIQVANMHGAMGEEHISIISAALEAPPSDLSAAWGGQSSIPDLDMRARTSLIQRKPTNHFVRAKALIQPMLDRRSRGVQIDPARVRQLPSIFGEPTEERE